MTDAPDPDRRDSRTDLAPHPEARLFEEGYDRPASGRVVRFESVEAAENYATTAGLPVDILEDPRAVWLRIPSGTFEAELLELLDL